MVAAQRFVGYPASEEVGDGRGETGNDDDSVVHCRREISGGRCDTFESEVDRRQPVQTERDDEKEHYPPDMEVIWDNGREPRVERLVYRHTIRSAADGVGHRYCRDLVSMIERGGFVSCRRKYGDWAYTVQCRVRHSQTSRYI